MSTVRNRRAWAGSIAWAVVVTGVILAVAIGVNLAIPGRVMHWDIVTIMGVVGLLALSVARRFRVI